MKCTVGSGLCLSLDCLRVNVVPAQAAVEGNLLFGTRCVPKVFFWSEGRGDHKFECIASQINGMSSTKNARTHTYGRGGENKLVAICRSESGLDIISRATNA